MIHRSALLAGLVFSDPRDVTRVFYRFCEWGSWDTFTASIVGDVGGRSRTFVRDDLARLVAVPNRPVADLDLTHYVGRRVRVRTAASELHLVVASTARHEVILDGEKHLIDVSITSIDGEAYHVSRLLEITTVES